MIRISVVVLALALSLGLTSASIPALALGNPDAPQGGTFNVHMLAEPPTIHPISAIDQYAQNIHTFAMATLLTKNWETYEWRPYLAEKWEISKDGKVFTFWLRKDLTFQDGQPLTAEDVKFSFEAIMDPKYGAAHRRPYFEGISKVEVVDPLQVKFYTRDTYFQNFDIVAGLMIIPKHIYSDIEKSKKMTKELVGSGPYKVEKFEKGNRIVLKKYPKFFANGLSEFKGSFNFSTIVFKFIRDENVYLDQLKKGDLDFAELSPEQYMKKTEGGNWDKSVLKVKAENKVGKNYRYVGWNLENPLFKDREVRIALAHLMNREEMIKQFRYDLSILATGPTDAFSDYASPEVKPILFDPKKAQEMLAKEGWKDSDKEGVLENSIGGKKTDFRFTLVHSNKEYEKYLTFYKEDLKKAGIDMEIKYLEWNSFLKLLDEGKFEAMSLAWTTSIDFDPKLQWHSSSAVKGGSNFVRYKVSEVDKLIDQGRLEMDRNKRIALLRKVYERIANDAPYVFLFNEKYSLYAVSNRIGRPADTFKYDLGLEYWWVKP